jgi:hypothetical protein
VLLRFIPDASTAIDDARYRYATCGWHLTYERKLNSAIDTAAEVNFRHADRDPVNAAGELDDNSASLESQPTLYFERMLRNTRTIAG